MSKIYLASSWRNNKQPDVVGVLTFEGHDVYDFRNPPGKTGFSWNEVDLPSVNSSGEEDPLGYVGLALTEDYLRAIEHPRAIAGFNSDFEAMKWCDVLVLLLPAGNSAHTELGWAVGAGKRTAILLSERVVVPELMYRMVDHISPNIHELLGWLELMR